MKIIATNKDGKEEGNPVVVSETRWGLMQLQFGKNLRWKIYKEPKKEIKKEIIKEKKQDERKISRDVGVSVKQDQRGS